MPLPADNQLDATIHDLYDNVSDRAIQPGQFGIVAAKAARLQAASQRRLVVAIDKATEAQERTNRRIERLEWVGIAIAIVGAILALVEVGIALS